MARIPINRRQRLLQVMDRYWGYGALRPLQREATQSVLAGRDSVVVLPAGGGKSLCFQAPALCLCGVTVVVSPLNSLVWGQVDVLRKSGIRAACVNSALPFYRQREVIAQLCGGELKLLYISPERLITEPMLDLLGTQDVAMFAIEQAHCISLWGHDFRPEYRSLGLLKERFPTLNVHAYTALATERVCVDIACQLKLHDAKIINGMCDFQIQPDRWRQSTKLS